MDAFPHVNHFQPVFDLAELMVKAECPYLPGTTDERQICIEDGAHGRRGYFDRLRTFAEDGLIHQIVTGA